MAQSHKHIDTLTQDNADKTWEDIGRPDSPVTNHDHQHEQPDIANEQESKISPDENVAKSKIQAHAEGAELSGVHLSSTDSILDKQYKQHADISTSPITRRSLRTRTMRVQYNEQSPIRMAGKRLRRLKNVKAEDCKLAIGPSQQYEGGEELYLD